MSSQRRHVVLLPGDGVGPEVVDAAWQVLTWIDRRFTLGLQGQRELIGAAAIDEEGAPLPARTLAACREADAILLGAVGDPRYDHPASPLRPEQGLLALRRELRLFANLRPVKAPPGAARWSPLKAERVEGVDLLIVRELTGGIYFGERGRGKDDLGRWAFDTMRYHEEEVRRVVRLGFELARARRKTLTSVDKANVLDSSRLWRELVTELSREYGDVKVEHQLVDSCAMRLITEPRSLDVVVTSNLFGDILSDEAAAIAGSLGLLPSASRGAEGPALYEPVHGSAPAIAGQGVANPVATLSSAALMLRYSLGAAAQAEDLEAALEQTLGAGICTADLGGNASTTQVVEAVIERLERRCAARVASGKRAFIPPIGA